MSQTIAIRFLSLLLICLSALPASSKIWQGLIVKVDGSVVVIDPRYTPYASATLYPKFCDTADTEGELLRIDISSVHVPFVDDVPALPKEFLAAAQPGMRVVAFMNRKQWHQVMLCVRDAETAVGYLVSVADGRLQLRRPQANWPNQMSNAKTFGVDQFPDRHFDLALPDDATGLRDGNPVDAATLLTKGQPVMVVPARPARLEIVPDPGARWHAEVEPLVGNYSEYEHRSNPRIDEQFYRGCTTGWFTTAKLSRRPVVNRPGSDSKDMDSWLLQVPYGDHAGEHVLPTRGHKTQAIIAGHFNTFPSFPDIAEGRRVTAWTYRTQMAPNWLVFDGQESLVEGTVLAIDGAQIQIEPFTPGVDTPFTIEIPTDVKRQLRLPVNVN